jgi:hypothetical protein
VGEFFPDEVFVVAAVDHRVDLAVFVSAKESAALGTGTKEEIGGFGFEEDLRRVASFDVQVGAFTEDGEGFSGSDLVGSDEVVEAGGVDLSDGRVFVVAKELTGDDLPPAVAEEPSVSAVITGVKDLTVDGLGFVEVVAEDGGLAEDAALGFHNLDGAGIALGQGHDGGDEPGLVCRLSGFVGVDSICGEVGLPGCLVSDGNGVDEFLGSADESILCDLFGFDRICVSGSCEECGGQRDEGEVFCRGWWVGHVVPAVGLDCWFLFMCLPIL